MYINAKGCCRQRSDNGQVETAGAMQQEGKREGGNAIKWRKIYKNCTNTHWQKGHMRHMQQQQRQRQLATHAKIFARGAAKPCRQRRVAECRVWTLAYCVRVQLRRLSQQQQQDEGSRSSLGRGGGTGGDSANSFYCCCYSSPALASLLRMLFPSCCCCFCSSPALILAMALRFCRVRFAALTVHQCGPGGQLAAMVLRLPQTLVPSPASSPASTAAATAAAACCLSVCAPLYLAPSSSAVAAAAASAPVSQRRHHR